MWPTPLQEIAEADGEAGLQTIPGVGKAIAQKVLELLATGSFAAWDRLTAETPESVLDLTEIPGMDPRLPRCFISGSKFPHVLISRSLSLAVASSWSMESGPKTAERIKEALSE